MARANPDIQSGSLDPQEARHGETPLHIAVALGRHELAQTLLHGGADTNLLTKTGVTAMDSAAGRGVQWLPGCRSETGAAQVVELLCNGGFRERNLVIASPLESGRNERGIPKLQIFFTGGE